MAFKEYVLDEQTIITVYKRSGSRSLRLSVTNAGKIRVTIPTWTPYQAGVQFAKTRLDWIQRQQQPDSALQPGQAVGKAHHLRFSPQTGSSRVSSRVMAGEIIIGYPAQLSPTDKNVQLTARSACVRALRRQAEQLLPQRLKILAELHGFSYSSVAIKQLKSRWGSCDQSQNLVFNLFLMQIPWDCIDYVILHELTHTKILHHGPEFWQAFEAVLPGAKKLRKQMRAYQPVLHTSGPALDK